MFSLFLYPSTAAAHEGTTPYLTMDEMKRKGEGPFARSRPFAFSLDWLGIDASQMYNEKRQPNGIRIIHLEEDRPADKGDLEVGDIIIGINGFTVLSLEDLNSLMTKIYFEGEYKFGILRNERETDETLFLKATMDEIDPKIASMISNRGSSEKDFKKGMFQSDFMNLMMGGGSLGDRQTGGGRGPWQGKAASPSHQRLPSGMTMEQMVRRSPQISFKGEAAPHNGFQQTSPKAKTRTYFPENRIERKIMNIKSYIRQKNRFKLSPEQARLLKNLYNDFLKHKLKLDADLQILELDLDENLEGNIDLKTAKQVLRKKFNIKTDKQYLMIQYYKLLKSILTSDQIKQLNL